MLPWSSQVLLLLCSAAAFLGGLGLAAPPEKEELWETWMRLALDEAPVVQLLEDIAHWMGNGSRGAMELQKGHQVVPSHLHQDQKGTQDVSPRRESHLVLQEVMEKLQRLNQSLDLMLEALEAARSRLEIHLEHLNAIPNPDGQSRSATSTFIPHGSHFVLLLLLVVLVPLHVILLLLLLLLASSALGIPELSALLLLAVAGQWLVASRGIWLVVSREKHRHRLTSTPERDCDVELLQEELARMEMSCVREPSYLEQPPEVDGDIPGPAGLVPPVRGGQRTTPSSRGATPELPMDVGKHQEPKPPPRANTSWLSPRSLCRGLTRAGQRCRKKVIPRQDFCHIHATGSTLAMDSPPGLDLLPPP